MKEYLEINKQWWDTRTESHFGSEFYNVDAFLKGESSLKKIEMEALGTVEGKSLLHLQCHFGQDTLSWARLGAKVSGVDLSEVSIKYARQLAGQMKIDAQFYESDVQQLDKLGLGKFDIVFTSYGALAWLDDLASWARQVHAHLKDGGIFCIAEFHPMFYVLDWNTLKLAYDYFDRPEGYLEMEEGSYADPEAKSSAASYYFPHSIASVMTALIHTGLKVRSFSEYDYSPYNLSPQMHERNSGEFVFRDFEISFPYVYSLIMNK